MVKMSLLLFSDLDISGVNLFSIGTLTTWTENSLRISFICNAKLTSEPDAKIVKSSPLEIIKPPFRKSE